MTQPQYDVALSFGSKDLETARKIAGALRDRNLTVFMDEQERHVLWGPALDSTLHNIYRNEAHHVVVLLSQNYETPWTALERQAALERVREGRDDYILAVGLDDTQHPDFSKDLYHQVHIREGIPLIADTILSKIRRIVPAPDELHYSTITLRDISLAALKRYSARILVNRGLHRNVLEHTLLKAARELRGQPSHKDSTQAQWGNRDAHYLWIFVFDSPEDELNNNWLGRVEWYSPNIPDGYKHTPQGDYQVGDIWITWRPEHREFSRTFHERTVPKANYIRSVKSLAADLERLVSTLRRPFTSYAQVPHAPETVLSLIERVYSDISDIHDKANNVGHAPVECGDLSEAFICMVSMAHNITIPVAPWNQRTWSAAESVCLAISHLEDYDEDVRRFTYELKKLTKD